VNGNRNVLRKLLLQPDGLTKTGSWKYKDLQTIDINYTLDVPINDPSKLYVAVFAQDKQRQRVLQASIAKAPAKVGVPPVGIVDDPVVGEIANINVYPNPASHHLNFYLENELTRDYKWEMIDQRGVTVLGGDVNHDLSSPQRIDIRNLANGIYFVRFKLSDKSLVYRKIAVLNSN
jgi:hypothetical protein